MGLFDKLFGKKEKHSEIPENRFSDEENDKDYELKSEALEKILGKMHDLVGHAIIPFAIGGAVDMYYFPNHIKGTGFATMELIEPDGTGPLPNSFGTYELVAFTKHRYNNDKDEKTPFNLIERKICKIFTAIGFYSQEAILAPNETCEIPNGDDKENICVVFDLYQPSNSRFMIGDREHHLLLCIEIFRSEMEFSMQNGSKELFKKLKLAGHYPYSDLDREPVA